MLKSVIKNAYSPYSKLRVAALLVCSDRYFTGVNVENVSYGLTVCAERVAIFKAVSEGVLDFKSILIYSEGIMPYPCGACRQVMSEFCSANFLVYISDGKRLESFTLGELLPHAFRFEL